jgi:hypothetical protein
MNSKLLEILLAKRVRALLKEGKNFNDATEIASKELKEELEKIEFDIYCSEHDC